MTLSTIIPTGTRAEIRKLIGPIEHRARALDAVERSYRQTVRDLGHPEEDAKIWVSAVMFRLLAATEEQEGATLSALKISHEELV